MTSQPVSGELFQDDWRAFWPAPGADLFGAALSDKPCEYHFRMRGVIRSARCGHKARHYQVNHLKLSLCICHARQMAGRKGLLVVPDRAALAAVREH
jgi:hypothetical protein